LVDAIKADPTGEKLAGSTGTVILVAAAHSINHTYAGLFPILLPFIVTELSLSYTQVGLVLAAGSVVGGLTQLGFGVLARYVPRNLLLGISHVCLGITQILYGFVGTLTQLIGVRGAYSLAASPQHPVGNALITTGMGRRSFGRSLGINNALANVGTVVAPLLGVALVLTLGWRTTFMVFSLPAIIVGFLIMFVLRNAKKTPSDEKRLPLGRELLNMVRNRNVLTIIGGQTMMAAGRALTIPAYVPLYLSHELNLPIEYWGPMFSFIMVGSILGPYVMGRASDKVGRLKLIMLSLVIASTATFTFTFLPGRSLLLPIVLFVMAFAYFASSPIIQAFLADSVDKRSQDLVFGLYFTVVFGIGALWPAVTGWVIDTYGFTTAFRVIASTNLLAAGWFLFAKERHD